MLEPPIYRTSVHCFAATDVRDASGLVVLVACLLARHTSSATFHKAYTDHFTKTSGRRADGDGGCVLVAAGGTAAKTTALRQCASEIDRQRQCPIIAM